MNTDNRNLNLTWTCPNCEAKNNGQRCGVCGTPRPLKQRSSSRNISNRNSTSYQGTYSAESARRRKQADKQKWLIAILSLVILALVATLGIVILLSGHEDIPSSQEIPTEETLEQNTILDIPCDQLILTSDKVELTAEGQKWMIQVIVLPENCTDGIKFISANDSVVTVSADGIITAVGTGSTDIIVRCGTQEIALPVSVLIATDSEESNTENSTSQKDASTVEFSPWLDISAAEKSVPNGSELTVRDIFNSFSNAAGSLDRMGIRYSNSKGSEYTGEVLRRDIDHDGSMDILFRTAKDYEGHYEIRFGNGSILKLAQTDQGATSWNEFYFEDLNGNGTEDILVQNVCSTTGGLAIGGINIYIDVDSQGKYRQVDFPDVTLKMREYDDGLVELEAPVMNYREVEVLGSQDEEKGFDYWYEWNVDSSGYVTRTSIRDIIAANGQIAVYYDFGGKVFSEISVQPVGVMLSFSQSSKKLEIDQIGSQWIKAYWMDNQGLEPATSSTVKDTPAQDTAVLRKMSSNMKIGDGADQQDYSQTYFWDQNKYKRSQIKKIVFTDAQEGKAAWDVSEAGDRSVLAWVDNDVLYVSSKQKISFNSDSSYLFAAFKNITEIDFGNKIVTGTVRNMEYMFGNCENLKSISLKGFDTSNVTNMCGVFAGCKSLKEIDLRSINTSRVVNMSELFWNCTVLPQIDFSDLSTGKVTTMARMFFGCSSLTNLDLSKFNTENVVDMIAMFNGCSKLQSLDLGNFRTSKVSSFGGMFSSCSSLASLNISSFDTSRADNLGWMFSGCHSLRSLDLAHFNTKRAASMRKMFGYCESLTYLNISGFTSSSSSDISDMFVGCTGLNSFVCNDEAINMVFRNSR